MQRVNVIIVALLEELICRYIGVQDDESKYNKKSMEIRKSYDSILLYEMLNRRETKRTIIDRTL